MSDYNPLDNPVWEALNGRQSEYAIKGKNHLRYRPDVFVVIGIQDTSEITIRSLVEVIPKDEVIVFVGFTANMEPYFKRTYDGQLYQMISDKIPEYKPVEYVELTKDDTPQIAELIKINHPGPYAPNVLELGKYIGVKIDEQLVSMAGERIKIDGYTEISLVNTHPDHRGKGYAKALSGVLIEEIINRGEQPFLHVVTHNVPAITLYEKLDFKKRIEYPVSAYMRL